MKIRKLETKKFYNMGPSVVNYHSSLSGSFVSYEINEILGIRLQRPIVLSFYVRSKLVC